MNNEFNLEKPIMARILPKGVIRLGLYDAGIKDDKAAQNIIDCIYKRIHDGTKKGGCWSNVDGQLDFCEIKKKKWWHSFFLPKRSEIIFPVKYKNSR